MTRDGWFDGPSWLVDPEKWPNQPELATTKGVMDEHRPIPEVALNSQEKVQDEWELLLSKNGYWRTIRFTAWGM